MSTPRTWPAACLGLWTLALAAAVGCAPKEAVMVSPEYSYAEQTLVEQLRWVEHALDGAIRASGIEDGWEHPFENRGVPWDADPEHRREILGSLLPQSCGAGGRLVEHLVARGVANPLGGAARIRAAWEAEGWRITDVYETPAPENPIFRADREDGAMLELDANSAGLILQVHSACSTDPTVSDPARDLSARDAFLEEVRRRER